MGFSMDLMINICLSVWIFLILALVVEKIGIVFPDWFESVLGGLSIGNIVLTFILLEMFIWGR